MDMGSNLQWSTASTITSWHHFHPTITKDCQKSDPASAVERCKGALICLHTSLKGEKTLYICPLWMWEAIKGGLQPQP
jgi:hypothetical protein